MIERFRSRDKYRRWHDAIIERAKFRNLVESGEKHHVVPRCFGGSNKKDNLVKLTYREHFLIHWLLVKITPWPEKRKMIYGHTKPPEVRARQSEALKRWHAENLLTPAQCEARSLRMLGNDYGKYGSGTTGRETQCVQ